MANDEKKVPNPEDNEAQELQRRGSFLSKRPDTQENVNVSPVKKELSVGSVQKHSYSSVRSPIKSALGEII